MSLRPDPSNPGLKYTFSEPIQRSLALAGDAARIDRSVVEPGHMLLGLLQGSKATALSVLGALKIDPDELMNRLEASLERGDSDGPECDSVGYMRKRGDL